MFNYLTVEFPTLDNLLHRANSMSSTHARYEHEVIDIHFLNPDVPYESIASGTPVIINLENVGSKRKINGYVHHIKPDLAPNKNYVSVTIIGASYVFKQQSQRVWTNLTASQIVADIATKNNFSYVAIPTTRIYDQVSQAGMSDWELMVRLAKQSGYSLKTDNTTLYFQPLTQEFTDFRQQSYYYSLSTLKDKSTGIYSFEPLIGEFIPYEDAKKASVVVAGVDHLTTNVHVNSNQTTISPTRKIVNPAVFDSYHTHVVAPTFEIAKYESLAADERNRYAYRGEVVLNGNPNLLPDSPVFLDGVGKAYSGYWTVLSVEHEVVNHYYTTKALVGTDSLGISTSWTDNKNIAYPDDKIRRVITPGIRQKSVLPTTVLQKNGNQLRQNSSSHFSSVTTKPKVQAIDPYHKWVGIGGNLRP